MVGRRAYQTCADSSMARRRAERGGRETQASVAAITYDRTSAPQLDDAVTRHQGRFSPLTSRRFPSIRQTRAPR